MKYKTSWDVDFLSLLLLVFITLKLTEAISWSWWWVLSPILIPLGIVVILLAVFGGAYLLMKILG